MAVTVRDVANAAGVAVGTVSRVLNNQPDVAPKLRARVQRALKEVELPAQRTGTELCPELFAGGIVHPE